MCGDKEEAAYKKEDLRSHRAVRGHDSVEVDMIAKSMVQGRCRVGAR